VEQLERLSFQI